MPFACSPVGYNELEVYVGQQPPDTDVFPASSGPLDRCRSLWGGYVVTSPAGGETAPQGTTESSPAGGAASLRFYFVGDTGYCSVFKEIGEKLGPMDLAAIPIGAYEPR